MAADRALVLLGRLPVALIALVLITAVVYLGYVVAVGRELGYPLDDSWIHQTFARNLSVYGGFVYNPGEPSSASTSPLWTLLLAPSYLLHVDHRVWTYLLGLIFLVLTGLLVRDIFGFFYPRWRTWAGLAGVGAVLEWHLDWAALSGMETILFIFLSLLLVRLGLSQGPRAKGQGPRSRRRGEIWRQMAAPSMGLVGGLLVVTRPEGVILFGLCVCFWLVGDVVVDRQSSWMPSALVSVRRTDIWLCLLGFVVLLTPYLVFNYQITGQPFPSTFYAKNSFYAEPLSLLGMGVFLAKAARELFWGPLLVLSPGLAFAVGQLAVKTWRGSLSGRLDRTELLAWLPLLWCAAIVVAYMVRLPAVYQYGRYLMPIIPMLMIYGVWGTLRLCQMLPMRLLATVIPIVLVAFWLVLWANGAVVYGWNVRLINDENVAVARWLRDNTPPGALIATHDIGAIGYFARRPILDTVGLITPEIAPYVRHYDQVLRYLETRKPEYLAMYPRWYPLLSKDPRVQEIFSIDQPYAVESGADNMVVYKFNWDRSPR